MADQSFFDNNKVGLGFLLSRVDLFKTNSIRVSWNIFVSKFVFGYRKKAGIFFFDFFGLVFFLRRSLNFIESISCLNLPLFCYSPKFVEGRRVFKNFYFFRKWVKGFLTSFSFMKELKLGVLPAAILCLNTKKYNEIFISEAINLGVPVVGLFDVSSFGLNFFSYLVPSNYTLENQLFYLRLYLRSYLAGYKAHLLRFFQEVCSPSFSQSGAHFGGLRKLVWKVKGVVQSRFKNFVRAKRFRRKLYRIKQRRDRRDSRISYCYKNAVSRVLARKARLDNKFSFDRRKFYKFRVFLFNPLTSIFKNKFLHKFRGYSKFDSLDKLRILFCRPKCIKNYRSVGSLGFGAYSRASKFLILRHVRRRERRRPFMRPFFFIQGQSSPLFSLACSEKLSTLSNFMSGAGDSLVDPFINDKKSTSAIFGIFLTRCKFLGAFSKNLGFATSIGLGFVCIPIFPSVAPVLNRRSLNISFSHLLNPCFRARSKFRKEGFEEVLGAVAFPFFLSSFSKFLFFLLFKRFTFFFKSRFVKESELKFFDHSVSIRFLGLTISEALRRNKRYLRRFFQCLKLYLVLFGFFRYSRYIIRNGYQACLRGLLFCKDDFWYFLLGFLRAFLLVGRSLGFIFFNILNFLIPGKYSIVKDLAQLARQHRFFFKSVLGGPHQLQSCMVNLISRNFGLNQNLGLKSLCQGITRKFKRESSLFKFFLKSLGQV